MLHNDLETQVAVLREALDGVLNWGHDHGELCPDPCPFVIAGNRLADTEAAAKAHDLAVSQRAVHGDWLAEHDAEVVKPWREALAELQAWAFEHDSAAYNRINNVYLKYALLAESDAKEGGERHLAEIPNSQAAIDRATGKRLNYDD